MKILIAYDGSDCAEAALDDLGRAGLPGVCDILVLSAAKALAPAPVLAALPAGPPPREHPKFSDDPPHRCAEAAAQRLTRKFPGWHVQTDATPEAASAAIISRSAAWKPDLIVVGSHGRSGFQRMIIGSVSHHVLNHAACSVRVGRCRKNQHDQPPRIIIAIDGSRDASAALRCVADRAWPPGVEIRLIGVVDLRTWMFACATAEPGSLCIPSVEEELRAETDRNLKRAEELLSTSGLPSRRFLCTGSPQEILVESAEQWNADCIFLGARGLTAPSRLDLGRVSCSVARRAHCSIEVVRSS
jgi:nucleotide-binding universal stress UspA family protein